MNLLDLPDEVIEGIFEHTQEDDILQLKLVSAARPSSKNSLTSQSSNPGRDQRGSNIALSPSWLAGLEDHYSSGHESLNERPNNLRSWQSRWG